MSEAIQAVRDLIETGELISVEPTVEGGDTFGGYGSDPVYAAFALRFYNSTTGELREATLRQPEFTQILKLGLQRMTV